jgi:haloalkane dehalogenase
MVHGNPAWSFTYRKLSDISPSIHQHYIEPLRNPEDRKGCWVFPKQIVQSSGWLFRLWEMRDKIANKPSMIVWGKKDIAFRDIELSEWKTLFREADVHEYDDVGHFVQEELGDDLCPLVEEHLGKLAFNNALGSNDNFA